MKRLLELWRRSGRAAPDRRNLAQGADGIRDRSVDAWLTLASILLFVGLVWTWTEGWWR